MSSSSFSSFFERLRSVSPIENQAQLAQTLQLGRATITLAKQKDAVPSKWIFALAEKFDINADWLAHGKGAPSSAEMAGSVEGRVQAVLPRLSAEGSFLAAPEKEPFVCCCLPNRLCRSGRMVCLKMSGPHLEPTIRDGDWVFIDQGKRRVYSGALYALGLDGAVLIRRIEQWPQGVVLYGDNPACPRRELGDLQAVSSMILGQVVWTGRELDEAG
jgi:hypothetical protein